MTPRQMFLRGKRRIESGYWRERALDGGDRRRERREGSDRRDPDLNAQLDALLKMVADERRTAIIRALREGEAVERERDAALARCDAAEKERERLRRIVAEQAALLEQAEPIRNGTGLGPEFAERLNQMGDAATRGEED